MGGPKGVPPMKRVPSAKQAKAQLAPPSYSMRAERKFEKGDYCPDCQRGFIKGDSGGKIYCAEQGCGFSGTMSETRTTDYAQINYKLMAIMNRGR